MNALKRYPETYRISRATFADLINVSEDAVGRYLRGERVPRRGVMLKIHEVTGGKVTANDFMEAA